MFGIKNTDPGFPRSRRTVNESKGRVLRTFGSYGSDLGPYLSPNAHPLDFAHKCLRMILLLPLFTLVLAASSALLINGYGMWAHTSSEQVRLDAAVLSLCHHRRSFLAHEIESLNDEIRLVQTAMDTAVLSCMGTLVLCPEAVEMLRGLSASGEALEAYQETRRWAYISERSLLEKELVKRNELDETRGRVSLKTPISWGVDGLQREPLQERRRLWQLAVGIKWPLILIPSASFSKAHEVIGSFEPDRVVIQTGAPTQASFRGFRYVVSKIRARNKSLSTTRAGCRLESTRPYRVRRFL